MIDRQFAQHAAAERPVPCFDVAAGDPRHSAPGVVVERGDRDRFRIAARDALGETGNLAV